MNERDLIATQTIKQVSEGGDQVRADLKATAAVQDQLAASSANLATVSEQSANKQTSVARAFDALEKRASPAARALAELESAQAKVARALDQGVASQGRANDVLDVYVRKLETVKSAAEAAAVAQENMRRQQSNASVNQGQGFNPSVANTGTYATQFEAAAKAQDEQTASLTKLHATIRPLEVEQGKLAAQMAEYKKLLDAGKISASAYAEAQAAAGKRLGDFSQNLRTAGTAGRVMSGEMTNLGYQLNDVVTGLALGQSPFMILAQQGGQVTQIFQNSKASLGDFADTIASKFTPATVAVGALSAAVGLSVAAAMNWANAQKEVENALKGIGKQSGATVSDINKIAEAAANSGNVTIGQAREFATAFAATGKIGKDNIGLATQAVDGLAKSLGVDGADAAKTFAAALADPAKGIVDLEAATGAYDLKTQELVKTLARQGEYEKARLVLIQATIAATKDAAEANGFWAASFKMVKDGFNLIGKDIVQGAELVKHDLGGAPPSIGVSKQDQFKTAQTDLSDFQQKLPDNLNAAETTGEVQKLYDQLAKLIDQLDKLKAAARVEALSQLSADLKKTADDANAAASAYIPQIDAIEKLEGALARLNKARSDEAVAGTATADKAAQWDAATVAVQNQLQAVTESQAQSAQYNEYVKAIAASWGDVSQSTALQLNSLQGQLQVAQAVTGADKMRAQQQVDINTLLAQGVALYDAQAIAAARLQIAQANANASVDKQIQSLKDSTELIKVQGTATEALVRGRQAYNSAIRDGASEEKASELQSETVKNSMARTAAATRSAADASGNFAVNLSLAADSANQTADAMEKARSAADGNFGSFNPTNKNESNKSVGIASFGVTGSADLMLAQALDNFNKNPVTADSIANKAIADGGLKSAILALQNTEPGTPEFKFGPVQASGQAITISDITSEISKVISTFANQTDKSQLQSLLDYEKAQPTTFATSHAISELTNALKSLDNSTGSLTNSTDNLNSTNQELLSPYYTTDPRTSHIGFRSQGMASGGYVDVPGGISSNDNMIAQIPVASGERIYVDPMPSKRGGSGTGTVINISAPMTFNGPVNKDEVGRTSYQSMQNAARAVRAATQ